MSNDRPAPATEYITVTPSPEMRAAVLAAAGLPDLTTVEPGDPIPPEHTGGMTGFVVGECGHRVAGSEWRAGFRNCERCGG